MSVAQCYLAQINIARARAPLTDPMMQGFVSQLAGINAAAEQSAGFVWRLTGDGIESAYLQPYDDPFIIVNMSVWETPDALRDYVYRSSHRAPLRNRSQWFTRMNTPHLALWWVPRDKMPSLEDGKLRLAILQRHGPTPLAFNFQMTFPPFVFKPTDLVERAADINYDGRMFRLLSNAAGECRLDTVFRYRQLGTVVWATYQGSGTSSGTLCGSTREDGGFSSIYEHMNGVGRLKRGQCKSRPELCPSGELRLHETWRWLDGSGCGESLLTDTMPS